MTHTREFAGVEMWRLGTYQRTHAQQMKSRSFVGYSVQWRRRHLTTNNGINCQKNQKKLMMCGDEKESDAMKCEPLFYGAISTRLRLSQQLTLRIMSTRLSKMLRSSADRTALFLLTCEFDHVFYEEDDADCVEERVFRTFVIVNRCWPSPKVN